VYSINAMYARYIDTRRKALCLVSLHCVGLQATTLASIPPPTCGDL
jgi:hypothetical protein